MSHSKSMIEHMFVKVDNVIRELATTTADGHSRSELSSALQELGRLRAACDAAEARLAAGIDQLGDSGADAATVLRAATRCSEREAKRRARRASGLAAMPRVAEALRSGTLAVEAADTLVGAAADTSPETVDNDLDLLTRVAARPADLAARDIRNWTRKHLTPSDLESAHSRRVDAREGLWFVGDDSMTVIHAKFDPVTGARLRKKLDAETDRLWRRDGGRDGTPDEVRTAARRRADALSLLLVGLSVAGDEPSSTNDAGGADQLVIVADVSLIDGTDPNGRCEIVDVGPVPPSILSTLTLDTVIRGALFDGPGRPLWLGRSRRLASVDQRLLMAVRDGGCRHCDAPTWQTQAHHEVEWAGRDGPTDIDKMVLVCQHGHTELHKGTVELVERLELQPP